MWIAKTPDELSSAGKSRRFLRRVAAVVGCIALLYLVVTSRLWQRLDLGFVTLPIAPLFPGAGWIALALALGAIYVLRREPGIGRAKTQICQKCNRIKTDDGSSQCGCGGEFRSIHEMKWVEGFPAGGKSAEGTNSDLKNNGNPLAATQ